MVLFYGFSFGTFIYMVWLGGHDWGLCNVLSFPLMWGSSTAV